MKEMEISVAFDNPKEEVLRILSKFNLVGEKELYDTYYVESHIHQNKSIAFLQNVVFYKLQNKHLYFYEF